MTILALLLWSLPHLLHRRLYSLVVIFDVWISNRTTATLGSASGLAWGTAAHATADTTEDIGVTLLDLAKLLLWEDDY